MASKPTAAARAATSASVGAPAPPDPLGEQPRSDAVGLTIPDEPVELKAALRAALLDGLVWEGQSEDLDLAAWLWSEWGTALEPLGIGRGEFDRALDAYRREAWLWLMGDRQWAQFVAGLIGRISRRLPGAAPA